MMVNVYKADDQKEMLDYFDPFDNYRGTLPRKDIHRKGLPNRHTAFYVLDSSDKVILVKRSEDKEMNPGMIAKPGGHVAAGNDYGPEEFLEEICHGIEGVQAHIVLPEQYDEAIKQADLTNTIVLTEIGYDLMFPTIRKLRDGSDRVERTHVKTYKGRYHGRTNPHPGEVEMLQKFTREKLEMMLAQSPDLFDVDVEYAIRRFGNQIFR